MDALESVALSLESLVVFRNLLRDGAIASLYEMGSTDLSTQQRLSCYARFAAELLKCDGDLARYLLDLVLADENFYVHKRAQDVPIPSELESCVAQELHKLEAVSQLTSKQVQACIGYQGYLPDWTNAGIDFIAAYRQRMDNMAAFGFGVFAKYRMFRLEGSSIVPVQYPDRIRLVDLKGYELQRKTVLDNTLALLKGKPSANVLLYGDAGTGKSSTVKAIVNEYCDQGLRLIQILPTQFSEIPNLMERLLDNPLKFILFIDDLSFAEQNDEFTALKAILEGSVVQKAPNVSIYATSNRMHLVKELFSDRAGDDIHRSETIAELSSLSERFGLSVGFYKPDKALYLNIVRQLKEQHGIEITDVMLDLQAERFALSRGGRSPRAARQFIEYLLTLQG